MCDYSLEMYAEQKAMGIANGMAETPPAPREVVPPPANQWPPLQLSQPPTTHRETCAERRTRLYEKRGSSFDPKLVRVALIIESICNTASGSGAVFFADRFKQSRVLRQLPP